MQPDRNDPDDPREWLRRARSNLARARHDRCLADVVLDDVCFDAQQAAEKSIKAVLIHRGIAVPKTHVIFDLLSFLQREGLHVPPEIQESAILSPYAVSARYPGLPLPISEEDYSRALDLAERVYRWAESIIALPPE